MPNEAFFHWNPELLGLGRQIGQINSGAFGVFSVKLSAPILVQCFPLFKHYFYKKLSLYIHIPNIYLGLEFEFGLQRIWDLAFVCVCVVRGRRYTNCKTLFSYLFSEICVVKMCSTYIKYHLNACSFFWLGIKTVQNLQCAGPHSARDKYM